MRKDNYSILLADDDDDDCMFFRDALDELSLPASLSTVSNGVELMRFLQKNVSNLPHLLFLDLNMPLKNGMECLSEIKSMEVLKDLPVIIYSTSSNPDVMNLLYEKGARHYIRKPADFKHLKSVINKAIVSSDLRPSAKASKDEFVIHP